MKAAITGWCVHLPGLAAGQTLAGWDPGAGCSPEDAPQLLGRKGLLAKEPATRLALCAVHRALGLPAKAPRRGDGPPDPSTAVVISSNLGNAATVAKVARAVRDEGVHAVSPLDAPNVSSNVIASTVAIWFGFGGPNLMVCSGEPSGLDAVTLGALLISCGRARRAVVVGVEPADPVATALYGAPLLEGSACVLLEKDGGVLVETGQSGPGLALAGHGFGAQGVLEVAVAAAVVSQRGGYTGVSCEGRTVRVCSEGRR